MQKLDLTSDRAPLNETGPLFPVTIIIPCPGMNPRTTMNNFIVSASSALYMSVVCLLTLLWIIFRFFFTHGIQDLQAVSAGIAFHSDSSSHVNFSPVQQENTMDSESSEEFPVRPPAPNLARKPLLRLFIVAALLFSLILLNAHLILSFSKPYRACRDRFGSIFPFLEDSRTSNGWRYSLAVLSSIYYRDSSIQNTVYASSMLFDFSRAFLISGVLLFYSDFPGAVFRHLPVAMSKSYFREWKNSFALFGYLYAPSSLIVLLMIRILVSPSSELIPVLASQYFLDAEALLLFLLCLASGTLFKLKRHQKKIRNHSIFTSSYYREGALSDSAVFSDRQRYLLLSEFHVTEYFAQVSFAVAACLLCHSVCNFVFYSVFQQLGSSTTPPWTLSLLFWLQYFSMPLMACLVMFVIYPREDANATSRVYMAALKPLLNAINKRPSDQSRSFAGHTQGSALRTRRPASNQDVHNPAHGAVPRVSSLGASIHQRMSLDYTPRPLSRKSNLSGSSHQAPQRTSRQIISDSAYYPEIYSSRTGSKNSSRESWVQPDPRASPPVAPQLDNTSISSESNKNSPANYSPLASQINPTFSQSPSVNYTSPSYLAPSKSSSDILSASSQSCDSSSPKAKSYIASFTKVPLPQNSLKIQKSRSSSSEVSSLISSMSSSMAPDSPNPKEASASFPIALNPNTRINIQRPVDAFIPTPYLSSDNSNLPRTRRSQTISESRKSSNLRASSFKSIPQSHNPSGLKQPPSSTTRPKSGALSKAGNEQFNVKSPTS